MEEIRRTVQNILKILKEYKVDSDYSPQIERRLESITKISFLTRNKCEDFLWFELAVVVDQCISSLPALAAITTMINK